MSELRGCNLEQSKYFQIGISHYLMYAFQNGFHHYKGHILFLELGISALGHQILRLVTLFQYFHLSYTISGYSVNVLPSTD